MMFKVNFCANLPLSIFFLCYISSTFRVDAINFGIYDFFFCRPECCNDDYINLNAKGLAVELHNTLYGQHLVTDTLVKSLQSHFNENPAKALVLSFHGSVGTGKNFVSKIIANNIYKLGMKSSYVRYFMGGHHFAHKEYLTTYKEQLKEWIKTNVTLCGRTMFIFDEVHMMPPGLIDIIKVYLESQEHVDGVDYRKSIFLFLSNEGGLEIQETTLEHWEKSKPRDALTLEDFEEDLALGPYNKENDGLWKSKLIANNLISHFIPFLPLERLHVKQCIVDDMLRKGHIPTEDVVNKVADKLQYQPEGTQLFSKTGCKRVSDKVDLVISPQTQSGKEELSQIPVRVINMKASSSFYIPIISYLETSFNPSYALSFVDNFKSVSVFVAVVYVMLMLGVQHVMKSRQAWSLKGFEILYLVMLAGFNILGAIRCIPELVNVVFEHGLTQSICTDVSYLYNPGTGLWAFLIIVSKMVELGVIAFVVLQKRPVDFSLFYHFITVILYCFYSYPLEIPSGRYYLVLNFCICSLLYTFAANIIMGLFVLKGHVIGGLLAILCWSQIVAILLLPVAVVVLKMSGFSCYQSNAHVVVTMAMYGGYFLPYLYHKYGSSFKFRREEGEGIKEGKKE